MNEHETERNRRVAIKVAAGLAIANVALIENGKAAVTTKPHHSKPGEFDFLAGEWKIHNRRLKSPGGDWDEFDGEATCWSILNGVGSIEELRIPARNFAGMGLRLLDVEKRIWNDYWVNAKSAVLTTPGQQGGFENGIGTFTAEAEEAGKTIKIRGVWDRITPDSCRWYQSTSEDGGVNWQDNWYMDWTRVKSKDK